MQRPTSVTVRTRSPIVPPKPVLAAGTAGEAVFEETTEGSVTGYVVVVTATGSADFFSTEHVVFS